jgi:hypothetical protein
MHRKSMIVSTSPSATHPIIEITESTKPKPPYPLWMYLRNFFAKFMGWFYGVIFPNTLYQEYIAEFQINWL